MFPLAPVVVAAALASPAVFRGSLLGVAATVRLDAAAGRADVELAGVPFGGTVAGTATFGSAGADGGAVTLHGPLRAAMRRRGCDVQSVTFDGASDEVSVAVRLPLVGVQRVRLRRAADGDARGR